MDRRRLQRGWAEFADRDWDHFGTLTVNWNHFETFMAQWSLAKPLIIRLALVFTRNLERVCQRRIDYFGVTETVAGLHLHVHLLLHGTAGIPDLTLEERWRWGNRLVRKYRPGVAGPTYVTKAIDADAESPFWSKHLPPQTR